ncbi:unnamed protein product, partial [Musa acuminata var. zebrina]
MWNLSFLLCLVTESIASLICFFLDSTQSTVHLDKALLLEILHGVMPLFFLSLW